MKKCHSRPIVHIYPPQIRRLLISLYREKSKTKTSSWPLSSWFTCQKKKKGTVQKIAKAVT